MAGVIDERQHPQHHGEIAGLVEMGAADGPLGAADALRHRGLRDEERIGDLSRGETADGPQRERHLRRG